MRSGVRAAIFRPVRPTFNWDMILGSPPKGMSLTRASGQSYFDSTGTRLDAANNVFPVNHNPLTLTPEGIELYEARTNSLRNNTMAGAASPSTKPNFWIEYLGGLTGLTATVSNPSTEDGINYTDWTVSGTPSAAGTITMQFEAATQIVAANGETWTNSVYYALSGGSLTGISATIARISENTVAGVFVALGSTTLTPPTGAALRTQRGVHTRTLAGGATVARVNADISLTLSGAAINITLRIGMPQLGASVTPVIPTSTVAVARAAPVISTTDLSWFNPLEGTFVASFRSALGIDRNYGIFSVNSGSLTNNIGVFSDTAGSSVLDITNSSVNQVYLNTAPAFSTIALNKVAISYKLNNFTKSVNGSVPSTDTVGTLPTVTILYIGKLLANEHLNGSFASLSYYPKQLSDAQVQRLST